MTERETIAVLGAGGTMGAGMARNLARSGFDVRAWNRSREKVEPLAGDDDATVVDSPAQAAQGASVVLTILSDGDAVVETMRNALSGLAGPAIWLQMSTIGIAAAESCAELAQESGLTLVDAPVLGTKEPAEKGELVILASGPDEVRERCQPIFDALGKKTMWIGEVGTGTRLKLVTNAWIVSVVEGVAETIALAQGLDIDPRLFLEAVSGGALDMPYLQMKAKAILERNFTPSFKLRLAAKDAALVAGAAERHGLDLPVLAEIRRRLEQGIAEHGNEDMIATWWTSAASAGVGS